ncbi:hypothetical protein OBBRIDRAFT_839831 [Obba rivulosa]|uniref:Uncharacterized protein n=1 Tax=Obba rivulosa TaxID=1052685 RepID=A0A8E2AGX7_9APHY|nr:hypothetical protein OBBRIDRAFT_839831 [Obba rivulosa]
MGGDLDHGIGDADRSLDWHVLEEDGNAEVGSSSQAETEAVQYSTFASGLHGSRSDLHDVEKAIVIVTDHPVVEGELEQNGTKSKTSPHLQFETSPIAYPTLVSTASDAQLEDANVVSATRVEMHG